MMGNPFCSNDIDSIYDQLKKNCSSDPNGRYNDVLVITVQNYDGELPKECIRKDEIMSKLTDLLDVNGGKYFRFNHGTMYFSTSSFDDPKDTGINYISQFDKCIELINNGHFDKSVMQVIHPNMSQLKKSPIPAVISVILKPKLIDSKRFLDIVATYREQEFSTWWPLNILELHTIQNIAIKKLAEEYHKGDITTIAIQGRWNQAIPLGNKSLLDDEIHSKEIASNLLLLFTADIYERKQSAEKLLIQALEEKKATTSFFSYDSIGLEELVNALFQANNLISSFEKYKENDNLSRCKDIILRMEKLLNELIKLLIECSKQYERRHNRDNSWKTNVDELFDNLISEIKKIKEVNKNGQT